MRRWEESEKRREGKRRRKKIKEEKVWEERRSRCEKVGKSRNTMFFQWFVVPEGRKVGSLKRRVRSHLARWEMKSCTPLWREAHFQVKMYKTHQPRTTFGSWHVEKLHAVVARSTFPSQNAQNTPTSGHFWKLRCRKSARRCGAKHISKSKCTKHTNLGPLLEADMSKKCTPLWREAHFQVKSAQKWGVRNTFGRSDVVLRGRRRGLCTLPKVRKCEGFVPVSTTITTTLHSTTLHYTTLHYDTLRYTTITLHYTTLHYNYNYNCNSNYNYTNYTNYIRVHYTTLH